MAKKSASKTTRSAARRSVQDVVRPREKAFYAGVEYFACWLLDNAEGETVTEEQLRPWAQQAWLERKKGPNVRVSDPRPYAPDVR